VKEFSASLMWWLLHARMAVIGWQQLMLLASCAHGSHYYLIMVIIGTTI
jgi:hypothetical protein